MNTLILNADFNPISIISARRAVILDLFNPNITVLSYYDAVISSEKTQRKIPAVMLYGKYIHTVNTKMPTRKNIKARDKNTCGYCGVSLNEYTFTIDHIIPISRFTNKPMANTWENQISCCKRCNAKKRDRTPEEAGMQLLFNPYRVYGVILGCNIPKEWRKYTQSSI